MSCFNLNSIIHNNMNDFYLVHVKYYFRHQGGVYIIAFVWNHGHGQCKGKEKTKTKKRGSLYKHYNWILVLCILYYKLNE